MNALERAPTGCIWDDGSSQMANNSNTKTCMPCTVPWGNLSGNCERENTQDTQQGGTDPNFDPTECAKFTTPDVSPTSLLLGEL